jgi:hypothetical protein
VLVPQHFDYQDGFVSVIHFHPSLIFPSEALSPHTGVLQPGLEYECRAEAANTVAYYNMA